MLDRQAVLEQTTKAIVAQGGPSMDSEYSALEDSDPMCAYRGLGGRRCALGHLIPDDEYHEGIEGTTLEGDWQIKEIIERSLGIDLSVDDVDFLQQLQEAHDNT